MSGYNSATGYAPPGATSEFVESVTGENVDNTDPLNPVVLPEMVLSFGVVTSDRIPLVGGISTSAAAPTYATGLSLSEVSGGFELVTTGPWANTGAVLNNTGFDIDVIGTFSYYPDNSGGTSRIDMWSETSADGIIIVENAGSARSIEIASSGESSGTKASRFLSWKNGEMVRFAFTDTGAGDCAFAPPSVTSTQGTVTAPSFSFQEAVVKKETAS